MDPHYNDSELWYFSDGIRELYIEIWIAKIWIIELHKLNQLNGSFMELHNSAKVMESHDSFTELSNSIAQFCNWFLEVRNLWKSLANFSSSIKKLWSSKIGYVAP